MRQLGWVREPGGRAAARPRRSRACARTSVRTRTDARIADPMPGPPFKLDTRPGSETRAQGGRTERAVATTCSLSSTTTRMCGCVSATTTVCAPMPPPTSTTIASRGSSSHENAVKWFMSIYVDHTEIQSLKPYLGGSRSWSRTGACRPSHARTAPVYARSPGAQATGRTRAPCRMLG